MESWTVRRVTERDAGRLRALRLEMLADSPLAYLETLAQAASRSHEGYRQRVGMAAEGPELAQFIADPGDAPLVGHAGGTTIPDEPFVTVVFSVYLTPELRGGKVLASMVEAIADWSTAAGRHELMLEVVVGNWRAVRAYEKLGFQDTGLRLPHPTVPVMTQLQMRRRI